MMTLTEAMPRRPYSRVSLRAGEEAIWRGLTSTHFTFFSFPMIRIYSSSSDAGRGYRGDKERPSGVRKQSHKEREDVVVFAGEGVAQTKIGMLDG